jgi:hypothetical protein
VISAKESANTNKKKEKKFSRSQENEVRRTIFLYASFDSMNSNQAENRSVKNRTL